MNWFRISVPVENGDLPLNFILFNLQTHGLCQETSREKKKSNDIHLTAESHPDLSEHL